MLYETMGDMKKAEEAYRTAIRVEPQMTGPRSNLAALLDRLVESEQNRPEAVQNKTKMEQWEQEAATLRRQELDLLARDVSLLPNSAQLQYRYGLSLYLHGEQEQAERALRKACELDPSDGRFLYTLALFYDNFKRYDEALDCLDRLVKLVPDNPEYTQLAAQVIEKRKRVRKK